MNMAFDVLALLDRLSIEQVAFCGVELGGIIGIWLAAHAPERLSSLVVSSTSAHYEDDGPWNDRAWSVRLGGHRWHSCRRGSRLVQPGVGGGAPGGCGVGDPDGHQDHGGWFRRMLYCPRWLGRTQAARPDLDTHSGAHACPGGWEAGGSPGQGPGHGHYRAKLEVLNGAELGVVEQADRAKWLISLHTKKSR